MKLFVDTESGLSFSIDVDFSETVLMIKQKIEKSRSIPVSKQTLFIQGKFLEEDHHSFQCYQVNPRLLLSIENPNQKNNDHVPQTEQCPSNPIHEFVNNQDWRSKNKQVLKKPKESPMTLESKKGYLGFQDSPEGKKKQVLHQTEQSPLKVVARRIENGPSRPSYGLLAPRYSPPVAVGSRRNLNQVAETEQPSTSGSVKEIPVKKKSKTSPMKLTVFVQPFEEPSWMIPVEVNAGDNVEELRKELVKMQDKGKLNLPQRYYFAHKLAVLYEDQSFFMNGVSDGDTIDIDGISD